MTIIVPHYAQHRPLYWVWKYRRRFKKVIHDFKRNPDCNERRRYRNEGGFICGEHKHLEPIVQGGHTFERVSVPFKPFRYDGPTYGDEGLVLNNWNWFDKGLITDDKS